MLRHALEEKQAFRAFYNERLVSLMSTLVWLKLGEETCKARRMPERPRVSATSFAKHVYGPLTVHTSTSVTMCNTYLMYLEEGLNTSKYLPF